MDLDKILIYSSLPVSFICLVSSGIIFNKILNLNDTEKIKDNNDLKNSIYASFAVSLLLILLIIFKLFKLFGKYYQYKNQSYLLSKNYNKSLLFMLTGFIITIFISSTYLFSETINNSDSIIKKNETFINFSYALFSFSLVYFLFSLYLFYRYKFKNDLTFTPSNLCDKYVFEFDFEDIKNKLSKN